MICANPGHPDACRVLDPIHYASSLEPDEMTAVPSGPRDDGAEERTLVARCENFREIEQQPCTGLLRYRWGQSQAACDTCGGWCGIAVASWIEVMPFAEARAVARAQQELRAAAEWLRTTSLDKVPGPPAVWRHLDARADALGDPT